MRRRELVTLVTVAAIGWPLAARTQQKLKVPIVGIMWNGGGVQKSTQMAQDGVQRERPSVARVNRIIEIDCVYTLV